MLIIYGKNKSLETNEIVSGLSQRGHDLFAAKQRKNKRKK